MKDNFPKITELNAANCRACSLQNKWPEFYEYLNSHYPDDLNLSQKLAMYYQELTEVPKCVICGNPVKFVNFRTGWRRTCCNKCSQLDPQTIEKKKQTSLKNYGVEWAAASKEHINKRKQTCLSRYGTTNGGWSEEAQKKIKQTNLKNRGTEFPMQDPNVVQKSRDTQKRLYGVEWNSQRPEVKKKVSETCKNKYGGIGYASEELRDKCIVTSKKRGNISCISNKSQDLFDNLQKCCQNAI